MDEPGSEAELAIGRLVLELVHLRAEAEPGAGPSGGPAASSAGHGGPSARADLSVARVSRQAIRASIELYQRGELTMGALAAGLGMSPGWATRVVEELVGQGFVERAVDPRDRRVVRVRLAPGAHDMAGQAYRWRSELVRRALEGFGPAERAAVRKFLDRIVADLTGTASERDAPGAPDTRD